MKTGIKSIDALVEKVQQIRKAEDPTAPKEPEVTPPADGAPAEGAADQEALASEVTQALEAGEISPDTDAVKEWATGKGLSPEAAEDFAFNVLNAYFSEEEPDGDEPGNAGGEPAAAPTGEPDGDEELAKSAFRAFAKLQHEVIALKKSQAAVADCLNLILDRVTAQGAEQQVVKSTLSAIADQPADKKSPVTTAPIVAGRKPGEIKQLILKGVLAKALTPKDVALYEQAGELSPEAEAYLAGK